MFKTTGTSPERMPASSRTSIRMTLATTPGAALTFKTCALTGRTGLERDNVQLVRAR